MKKNIEEKNIRTISFRVDEELYNDFNNLCTKRNKGKSEVLRELISTKTDVTKIEEAKDPIVNLVYKTVKETIESQTSSLRGLIVKTYHSAESSNSISAQILSTITRKDVNEIRDREYKKAVYKLRGGDRN